MKSLAAKRNLDISSKLQQRKSKKLSSMDNSALRQNQFRTTPSTYLYRRGQMLYFKLSNASSRVCDALFKCIQIEDKH